MTQPLPFCPPLPLTDYLLVITPSAPWPPPTPPCFCDGWLLALLEHSAWTAFPLPGAHISSSNGLSLSLGFIPFGTQLRVWLTLMLSKRLQDPRSLYHWDCHLLGVELGCILFFYPLPTSAWHSLSPLGHQQHLLVVRALTSLSEGSQNAGAACGFFQVLHLAAEAASENTTAHLAAQIKILAWPLILFSLSGSPHPNFWK